MGCDSSEVYNPKNEYPIRTPHYGVIVGRFQVHNLHDGHLDLLNTVRALHQRVIVFLGVNPGGANVDSPLDFDTRRRMIQTEFPEFSVHPLLDCSSDEVWSLSLDSAIKQVALYGKVTLYGGRTSFVPHYTGRFTPVELKLSVSHCSGTLIRNTLTNYILNSVDFRAGVIYSINNLYPRVITCVDVAILHAFEDGVKVLLGRKVGETSWRFVGGHADPKSDSFEADVKREAYEETMLDINSIEYLGSRLVDDWRWRRVPDKIKTLFFVGWSNYDKFEARDDINELQWFKLEGPISECPDIVQEHQPLFAMLLDYYDSEGFNEL